MSRRPLAPRTSDQTSCDRRFRAHASGVAPSERTPWSNRVSWRTGLLREVTPPFEIGGGR